MLLFKLRCRPLNAGSSVVHQHIELAELGVRFLEHLTNLVGVAEMRPNAQAAHTQLFDFGLSLRGGSVAADIVEGNVRSTGREFERNCLSDAPRSAGDQNRLAFE